MNGYWYSDKKNNFFDHWIKKIFDDIKLQKAIMEDLEYVWIRPLKQREIAEYILIIALKKMGIYEKM